MLAPPPKVYQMPSFPHENHEFRLGETHDFRKACTAPRRHAIFAPLTDFKTLHCGCGAEQSQIISFSKF